MHLQINSYNINKISDIKIYTRTRTDIHIIIIDIIIKHVNHLKRRNKRETTSTRELLRSAKRLKDVDDKDKQKLIEFVS